MRTIQGLGSQRMCTTPNTPYRRTDRLINITKSKNRRKKRHPQNSARRRTIVRTRRATRRGKQVRVPERQLRRSPTHK